MNSQKKILKEVAEKAHELRSALILKFKKQGCGNVVIDLPHGFAYLYGETIKTPTIKFPGFGEMVEDLEFFSKTIWK